MTVADNRDRKTKSQKQALVSQKIIEKIKMFQVLVTIKTKLQYTWR